MKPLTLVSNPDYEQAVATTVRALGFDVVRGGWPDFLILSRDGQIRMALEVKSPADHVHRLQRKVHAALRQAGVDVRVIRRENFQEILRDLNAMDRGAEPERPSSSAATVEQAINSLPWLLRHPARELCDTPDQGPASEDK